MRLNQFLAKNTSLSRRSADKAILDGRVTINNVLAKLGDIVIESDSVVLDGNIVQSSNDIVAIILNKPVGYVCSRNGQGSSTIYDLLPNSLHHLNPIGRLDKDSSGILLMTNDGNLANKLSHPSSNKQKVYHVTLSKKLTPTDVAKISGTGVDISDSRPSKFRIENTESNKVTCILVEGRNRQIRRTFEALGYKVMALHRSKFANYELGDIESGRFEYISV